MDKDGEISDRGSRIIAIFGKHGRTAESCAAVLCKTYYIDSGATRIIPIATSGTWQAVKNFIAWTVVPDNEANFQRRIGDRTIGRQCEPDDGLVIVVESP